MPPSDSPATRDLRRAVLHYSQVPNILHPRLLIFDFFQPPELIRNPRLIMLWKMPFFTNPLFHFLSLLVVFTPHFYGKIAYCCIYFSFILHENLLLFFLSLYNHLKLFLKFHSNPQFIKRRKIFATPLSIRTAPVYLALESSYLAIHYFSIRNYLLSYSLLIQCQHFWDTLSIS